VEREISKKRTNSLRRSTMDFMNESTSLYEVIQAAAREQREAALREVEDVDLGANPYLAEVIRGR
jgi:hypothetical protein